MYQWHTPVPIEKEQRGETFSNFNDNDIVYPIASAKQQERLLDFIDDLTIRAYTPNRPYRELVAMLPDPKPLFISHIQAFVFTAKLKELRFVGLVQHLPLAATVPAPPRLSYAAIGDNFQTPSDHSHNRYIPQGTFNLPTLTYGKVTVVDPTYTKTYYRCCGFPEDHPGCWHGPIKGEEKTPWSIGLSAATTTREEIIEGLSTPIVKGSFWKVDPTEKIEELRRNIIKSIRRDDPGALSGLDYYLLLELTHNERDKEMEEEEEIDPLILDFPGKQYYLEAKRYSVENANFLIELGTDIQQVYREYGDILMDNLRNVAKIARNLLNIDNFLNLNEYDLKEIRDSISFLSNPRIYERIKILKFAVSIETEDNLILRKKASIVGIPVSVDIARKGKIMDAARKLGDSLVLSQYPIDFKVRVVDTVEREYVNYVNAHILPGYTFEQAYESHLTGVIPPPLPLVVEEVQLSPYGNGDISNNRFSTTNQFLWKNDSCWFDSTFTALFSIPGNPWETEIRNATKAYVKPGCDAVAFRDAIVKDILYLQQVSSASSSSQSIKFFEQCAKRPQKYGVYESADDTFDNIKALFKLSDDIVLRYPVTEKNPKYSTFALIMSRPNHFVPYILQLDGKWLRLDDVAESSERILYVDEPKEGIKKFKNKDVPGEFFEFEEKINFYLDIKTDLISSLSSRGIFNQWKLIRNRLDLIQPVYLNDDQARIKNRGGKKSKMVPSHNKFFYSDLDTFEDVVNSIQNDTFNYANYPDGIGSINFAEPPNFQRDLLDLISVFDPLKINNDTDRRAFLVLLRLAVKPLHQSIILYDDFGTPSLMRTNDLQLYVEVDEREIMHILEYFFKDRVAGQVIEI